MRTRFLLSFIAALLVSNVAVTQVKTPFSGEPSKYKDELNAYLGPNLNDQQKSIVSAFYSRWDSSGFTPSNMVLVSSVSVRIATRNMRPAPHFTDFLKTLTDFSTSSLPAEYLGFWLTSLAKMMQVQSYTNDFLDRHFRNTGSTIREKILYESGNVRWKMKGGELKFAYDSVLKVIIKEATLTARAVKDSTELYNVSGIYFPESVTFKGTNGRVNWVKAGYSAQDVFADMPDFTINMSRTTFTCDSALLNHNVYFKNPVIGKLTDQATSYSSPEKAIYPRFETYTKSFQIGNLYKGVNYEGGLTLDGASVKGTGQKGQPARITLYRNDTLYFRVNSVNFLLTKAGITSQEASASLYLGKDSIFHSSLGFSYNASSRLVTLFRNNNPVSQSPYYDSFHSLDMYFESLSWNMNESRIYLSRARGASIGQARFESVSYFTTKSFNRLEGIDDYHPLFRLKQFADWYYSQTFPVSEFAKWMKRPEEAVTGLCIDLANKGFLFYDRTNNEVTIKKKVDDFIASNSKRKDYDVMAINSETQAPLDNAWLDLKNYRLTVNGVPSVFLSDSQKVAVYPYKQQLVIGKNRDISFDGVVEAGLFTIFGHNFQFSYDTFKIRLQKIDSIRIAVETEKRDQYGNAIAAEVNNLIQLTTAELYIDKPNNKSGLKSLKQYPIINAVSYSYIFYDRLPGLEGIYKQKDFYFRIDPFTYQNIDHYKYEDLSLEGMFFGGPVLKPTKQYLTIQEDNSLGFRMNIPQEGLDVYGGKGKLFDNITLNNKGLVGKGTLKRLTSTTVSDEYRFYPDSMITRASSFNMSTDKASKFPELKGSDVDVKWIAGTDEWLASNPKTKPFDMYANGTRFDGLLNLTPGRLKGSGVTDMSDSKILSENFSFSTQVIKADTSDYNLKSLQGDGLAFIADNVNATIDFGKKQSRFSLNTDSSFVKFPEIQYICKMTDFVYDMNSKVLSMEQKGKSSVKLLTADQLLKLDFNKLDKPTFISTNNLKDTISFSSWKGKYYLQKEYIEAQNINYIHIADALIQPDSGKITITKRARIRTLQNATIAVNNKHILHSANILIDDSKRYTGSAVYNYVDYNKGIQQISFPTISVDTATTTAKGYIPVTQKFTLSPAFTFTGDVKLSARADNLYFVGAVGIVQNCKLKSYPVKFRGEIDPKMVMIPLEEKPRDINDNLVFSGSFINIDSAHIYPAFLSERKSWSDAQIVTPEGYIFYEKETSKYKIASKEKLADQAKAGPIVVFDKNYCIMSGEGKLNLGTNFDLVTLSAAGKVIHGMDSSKVDLEGLLGLDFHFSQEALKMMSDEIRAIPTLTAFNLNSEIYRRGMKEILGEPVANQINEEIGLFGTMRNMPKEYNLELLLNDVKLYWNAPTASFRSKGKIGIGFIGQQPVNVYVDGLIEIQRRRSGDMIDIYLKADQTTWYYFSYFRGVMMTQAGNTNYNALVSGIKLNDRKDPRSSVRIPYTYMVAVEDRLQRFLRRMQSNNVGEDQEQ